MKSGTAANRQTLLLSLSLMICSVVFATVQAQVIEEVVVTAQKRAESVQDVPIAISALDAEFIKDSNIVGVDKLTAFAPGLNGTSQQAGESVFTMRGIGTYAFGVGADNSVGMFIDDIPIGRPTLIGSAFFDVERIEVVKGPQGTLFGRNASAGAISIINKQPDLKENSLEGTFSVGNEGQRIYEGVGNLAATDQLAARLAVRHDERDGTFKNTDTGDELNNRDHTNARLSLRYDATDNFAADFSTEYSKIDTRVGFVLTNNAFVDEVSQNGLPKQDIETMRYRLKLTWDINDDITLTSNTSYIDYDLVAVPVDVDVSNTLILNLLEPQEGDQFVQELRLNGSTGSFDWFIGASYIEEKVESHTSYQWNDLNILSALVDPATGAFFCGLLPCQDFVHQSHTAETDNTSYAIYTDVAWQINDQWKLSLGARVTHDKKNFLVNQPVGSSALHLILGDAFVKLGTNGVITDKDTWTSVDPRVTLDFALTDNLLLYASFATGYKSGGFNSDPNVPLSFGLPQGLASFDEESVLAYEIGMKSRFWDGRAQVNVSAYFNDYSDMQVEAGDLVILIENAAQVETKGIEIEGRILLTENFSLLANYSYLDAEFEKGFIEDIDVSGRRLQRAPEHSGAIIANYTVPFTRHGELSIRGEYIFSSEVLYKSENPLLNQKAYDMFNARVGFESSSGKWGIAFIGDNLADEEYLVHRTDPLADVGMPSMSPLYRVELSARF